MLVKIGKYIGFCVYRRSYLLWSPVIATPWDVSSAIKAGIFFSKSVLGGRGLIAFATGTPFFLHTYLKLEQGGLRGL